MEWKSFIFTYEVHLAHADEITELNHLISQQILAHRCSILHKPVQAVIRNLLSIKSSAHKFLIFFIFEMKQKKMDLGHHLLLCSQHEGYLLHS